MIYLKIKFTKLEDLFVFCEQASNANLVSNNVAQTKDYILNHPERSFCLYKQLSDKEIEVLTNLATLNNGTKHD